MMSNVSNLALIKLIVVVNIFDAENKHHPMQIVQVPVAIRDINNIGISSSDILDILLFEDMEK